MPWEGLVLAFRWGKYIGCSLDAELQTKCSFSASFRECSGDDLLMRLFPHPSSETGTKIGYEVAFSVAVTSCQIKAMAMNNSKLCMMTVGTGGGGNRY